jgi:antitoxin component YwqK of YwqJK toxin-antitoxin module
MKVPLFALFVALLMVGCGESDLSDPDVVEDATADAVDWSKLQDRDGVMYLPNEENPFTGRAESFHKNGQKESEKNFKDGKLDGLLSWWHESGRKVSEGNFKDGKMDGFAVMWYENGQKQVEGNYRAGKLDGLLITYNEDGTEDYRFTYKDGEQVYD